MKINFYPLICSLIIALFLQFNQASAQALLSGTFPSSSETLLGVRYRNVRNVNAIQTAANFTGIPDLGSNRSGSRNDQTLNYGTSGTYTFTLTYNSVTNTFTSATTIAGITYTNTLTNVSGRLTGDGKTAAATTINLLSLSINTQNSSSTISVTNLTIDGMPVSGTYSRSNNNGQSNWYLQTNTLNNGFIVTGTVNLSGNFTSNTEGQRVQFIFSNASASAAPLPVVWGGFNSKRINSSTTALEWKTLQENNASHYNVQRSVDGVRFETIGRVQAQGTTANVTEYRFDDKQATGSVYYYRLQQVDLDAKMNFSAVVKQGNGGKQTLVGGLGGNNVLVQFFSNENRQLRIISATGTVVKHISTASSQQIIDINSLPAGIYTLQIINADATAEVHRFVK